MPDLSSLQRDMKGPGVPKLLEHLAACAPSGAERRDSHLGELLICGSCDHICRPDRRDLSMPPSDCPNCYGGRLRNLGGRLMSCALTADAVIERRKTVTRRLGWKFVEVGDRLQLCRKVMGRKKGEPLERLAYVEVIDVRRERLDAITDDDVAREGFPVLTAAWFVDFFCEEMRCEPDTEVTRVEWRYLDPTSKTDAGAR